MENNLLITNLKVSVGKKKNKNILLDSFTYKFEPGKIYFIIGPSGVGKTTLISHFNGLKKSDQGSILINNKYLITNKKIKYINEIRKDVQLVFQFPEHQLFKSTVIKDVSSGPINLGVSKEKAQQLAIKYLNKMNIDNSKFELSPFILSNGQKRKVAIAGIMAIEPNIYIFDEPTVGLDPQSEINTINLIKELKQQGKTVIVVSHDTDNALEIADEVLLIFNKKLLAYGKPYEIFSDDNLMSLTWSKTPYIIETIKLLICKSNLFNDLLTIQPKTIDELSVAINKLMKGGK